MKAIAVIFTHPPDYPLAAVASRCMERNKIKVVWVIDHQDTVEGIPGVVDVVMSYAPRNGNLLGSLWVSEQLRIMQEVGDGYDWVLKLDSDTVVTGIKWLKEARPEHQLVGTFYDYHAGTRLFLCGQCYAVRPTALSAMRESPRLKNAAYVGLNEDTTIGGILPDEQILKHIFHGRKGMLSGWRWDTDREPQYWIDRYEVLTIQPRKESAEKREEVLSVMLWLEEGSLQSLQLPPPSIFKKARSLSKALVSEGRAIIAGDEKLADGESDRRSKICSGCPEFQHDRKTCGICHCYIPAKTRFRTQHCPCGKW